MLFHFIVCKRPMRKLKLERLWSDPQPIPRVPNPPCSPSVHADYQGRDVTTWNSPLHSWMTPTIKTSSSFNKRPREGEQLEVRQEAQRAASAKRNMWVLLKSWFEQTSYKKSFLTQGKLSSDWVWDDIKMLFLIWLLGKMLCWVWFFKKVWSLRDTSLSVYGGCDRLSEICFKILQKTKVVGRPGCLL